MKKMKIEFMKPSWRVWWATADQTFHKGAWKSNYYI